MAGKGKPRPEIVLTVKTDGAVTSLISTVKSPPDPHALAAKLAGHRPLSPDEYDYLLVLLKKKQPTERHRWVKTRAQEQSLRVASFFIILRDWYPEKQTKDIEGLIAKTFKCSVGAVRQDVRFAQRLEGGRWWQCAMRDKLIW